MTEYEDYFKDDRKLSRQERKRRTAQDRSKYKKSEKKKEEKPPEGLLRGRVLSIVPQDVTVDVEGKLYHCTLRGVLKKEKGRIKNLVAVGDFVHIETTDSEEGVIAFVEPRFSTLSRAESLTHRREHLIAVNIDQVLITASVVLPTLKPPLVDRYIIAAQKGNMEPVIVVNKIDLLGPGPEQDFFNLFCDSYKKTGIPLLAVSADTGEGLEELETAMKGKASVFSGQSGVGKSSLINRMLGLDLAVGEPVERTRKGAHTTTTAQLIRLKCGGFCIDTPGIKSFGVWDLERQEIESYFDEIREIGKGCKFQDCSHTHEEECAVKAALEEGRLLPLRYESYSALLQEIDEKHRRR